MSTCGNDFSEKWLKMIDGYQNRVYYALFMQLYTVPLHWMLVGEKIF